MRKSLRFVTGLLLILALCACGAKKEDTEITEPAAETTESAAEPAGSPADKTEEPETVKEPAAESTAAEETAAAPAEGDAFQKQWDGIGLRGESPGEVLAWALEQENVVTWNFGQKNNEDPYTTVVESSQELMVYTENGRIRGGQEVLDDFMSRTAQGEKAKLHMVSWHTLTGTRYGVEYFEELYPTYPQCWLTMLEYDGEQYHCTARQSDQKEGEEQCFPYLLHLEDAISVPTALYHKAEHYVLTKDPNLTWKQIEWGMLSSQFDDFIPHCLIASLYYNDPAEYPADSYIPAEEERPLWTRLNGKEGRITYFCKANLDSEKARALFSPEAAEAQSMLSFWEEERILWRVGLPYSIHSSMPTADGILLCGTEYNALSAAPQAYYLERYDCSGKRLWQYKENADSHGWPELLDAGEEDGALRCVIRKDGRTELLTFDENGQLLRRSELAVSDTPVCLSEEGALYAVQEKNHRSYKADIYSVSEDRPDQQALALTLEAPEGQTLTVCDLFENEGFLYVSAYLCTDHEVVNRSARDEVQDVIEECFEMLKETQDFTALTPELTALVKDRYTAVLYIVPIGNGVCDAEALRILKKWPGSLGGCLYINENGEVAWEMQEIGEIHFSPATSAYTLSAPCRVIQFFYHPSEEEGAAYFGDKPGGYMVMEKTEMYRR